MNISEHISYKEAVRSITAIRNHIDNRPSKQQLENMHKIADYVFEPLREGLGGYPIIIGSFFRCKELNTLIGGATNSQHMALRGAAIDLDNDNVKEGPDNAAIFNYILDNLDFDQLIWEYGTDHKPDWVHVSFNKGSNRKQVLRCDKGVYKPLYS